MDTRIFKMKRNKCESCKGKLKGKYSIRFCSQSCWYNYARINNLFSRKHSKETRKKISINHVDITGSKNPMFGKHFSKKTIEQMKISCRLASQKRYQKNPELHPNRLMVKYNRISKGQLYLFEQIKKIYPEYKIFLNFQVKNRFIDVAIPRFRLGFEYDGLYWHKDKQKDIDRDNELKEVGWNIIHIRHEHGR